MQRLKLWQSNDSDFRISAAATSEHRAAFAEQGGAVLLTGCVPFLLSTPACADGGVRRILDTKAPAIAARPRAKRTQPLPRLREGNGDGSSGLGGGARVSITMFHLEMAPTNSRQPTGMAVGQSAEQVSGAPLPPYRRRRATPGWVVKLSCARTDEKDRLPWQTILLHGNLLFAPRSCGVLSHAFWEAYVCV